MYTDNISRLPDDILLKFISLVDFQTAVRTSILAKRWSYLWTLFIDLDLDPGNMSPCNDRWSVPDKITPEAYLNWVNQVIDAHRAPCVRKFHVYFHSKWGLDNVPVEKWAKFAFSKGVEELDLDLSAFKGKPVFSLRFDTIAHSLINGTFNLKSLRMSSVDISGEALEFILLHSLLLERLCVFNLPSLHTLHIFSNKLKHLTLKRCSNLKELEIDAVDLISFKFIEYYRVHPHIVFKRVPKLVEIHYEGGVFFHPFPFLRQIFDISKQLTKLSFYPYPPDVSKVYASYFDSVQRDLLFFNVEHITLTIWNFCPVILMFRNFLLHACPNLHGLKLQVNVGTCGGVRKEAKLLREIKLGDEKNDEVARGPMSDSKIRREKIINYMDALEECDNNNNIGNMNLKYKNKRHSNLKVLEIVGFRGIDNDVEFAMDIIASSDSFEALICDRRDFDEDGEMYEYNSESEDDDGEYTNPISRRARKLAKLLLPRIRVGIRDESGLLWVS